MCVLAPYKYRCEQSLLHPPNYHAACNSCGYHPMPHLCGDVLMSQYEVMCREILEAHKGECNEQMEDYNGTERT